MFGLSHLQFYDIQNIHNVSSTDRNIFKLGSNSILAKLIRSSELLYADDERNVNTVAMNLTANEKNNNGCNNNDSGKSSPTVRKHINRSINGGSNNSNNGNCNSDKDSVNTQDGHQKSSELNSPVNSVKINNELAEVNANTTVSGKYNFYLLSVELLLTLNALVDILFRVLASGEDSQCVRLVRTNFT